MEVVEMWILQGLIAGILAGIGMIIVSEAGYRSGIIKSHLVVVDGSFAVKLLKKGIFDQKSLITHKFNYKDVETAFKIASKKTENYIKGTITF